MSSVKTPEELFLHELEDIYDAEHRFLKALPTMAKGSEDPHLAKAFEEHEEQTQTQIENLDKVFESLGEKPKRIACYGAQGLVKEYEHFVEEGPSPSVLTLFSVGAGQKVEEYEICSYKDLSQMANLMGKDDIVTLLQANLEQEEAAAEKLETIGEKMNKATIKAS
jgi:ferritin-like metal-binding protein YciE